MGQSTRRLLGAAFALAVLLAPTLTASSVLHVNLRTMCADADHIVRGQVVDIQDTTVELGGTVIPAAKYTLRVGRSLKGAIRLRGKGRLMEITIVGPRERKPADLGNGLSRFYSLPDHPLLEVGREYVLFTTAPSALNLSTTVGLGQGAFTIGKEDGTEVVLNEADNLGLFDGMDVQSKRIPLSKSGKLTYAALESLVTTLVQEGR